MRARNAAEVDQLSGALEKLLPRELATPEFGDSPCTRRLGIAGFRPEPSSLPLGEGLDRLARPLEVASDPVAVVIDSQDFRRNVVVEARIDAADGRACTECAVNLHGRGMKGRGVRRRVSRQVVYAVTVGDRRKACERLRDSQRKEQCS